MRNFAITLSTIFLFCCHYHIAAAYFSDYPPYKFKDGPPQHLKGAPLVDFDNRQYISSDKAILIRLNETADNLDFLVKDGGCVVVSKNTKEPPLPYTVYQVDMNSDGLKDFIILYNYRGNGLGSSCDMVEICLKKKDGGYQRISYDTMSSGIEDFVDLDKDGKYEVLITSTYFSNHTYFVYNVYRIENYKLVNADTKYTGYPKFVWYTNKPNDKDTSHLTIQEKQLHSKEVDGGIKYREITGGEVSQ